MNVTVTQTFFWKFLCELTCNNCSHYTLWFQFCSLFLINLRRRKRSEVHKSEALLLIIDLDVTASFVSCFLVDIVMLNLGGERNIMSLM